MNGLHMTADEYLQSILAREAVDISPTSRVRQVQKTLHPLLSEWAGTMLRGVHPSGSFAKGTANHSGTDIDLFVSLSSEVTEALKEIYKSISLMVISCWSS
jgi:tRNA nucleotidyltransferase (CCA-adding enzyme)